MGEIRNNRFRTPMKIVRYNRADDITVEFQDNYKHQVNTTYANFKRTINNPYDPRIYGKGYRGVGEITYIKDGVTNGVYTIWKNILRRCYDETQRINNLAYEDCEMCEEWCNYQNFGRWHRDNWYDVGGGRMHVDKDILFKGNKLYSPETCILVPQRINMIFMSKPNKYNLPSGISITSTGRYASSYNGKAYGVYETLEEAVKEHDKQKRLHIKKVVKGYGSKLPKHVQEALLNW